MTEDELRKMRNQRWREVLRFARIYRSLNKTQLAAMLDYDPGKLEKVSNPTISLLMPLARSLDWRTDQLIEYITQDDLLSDAASNEPEPPADADWDTLNRASLDSMDQGRYHLMLRIARRMYLAARTPEERAQSCNREYGAFDAMGWYEQGLESLRRGLREHPIPSSLRVLIESNLALVYYRLGELYEAHSIAHSLLGAMEGRSWDSDDRSVTARRERASRAFALLVRGLAVVDMLDEGLEDPQIVGQRAYDDLTAAVADLDRLSVDFDRPANAAMAEECRGALIELSVWLGELDPREAVQRIYERLPQSADPADWPSATWIEAYGWWACFGANIALRHFTHAERNRWMAIFEENVVKFADQLDNWALRERVFRFEYANRQKVLEESGLMLPPLDDDERRLVIGTIARFRKFRELGIKLLQAAA